MRENRPSGLMRGGSVTVIGPSASQSVRSRLLYSGFLIRFDPQHKWFWAQQTEEDDFRHLRQVIYVSERAPKYVLEIKGGDALYAKGIEWEHEREWRIIRNFNDAARKVGPDQYGKDVLLFAIPPDCIRGIVIGYRATPENVSRLRGIVSHNPPLSHVRFERAAMRADGQIEIVPDNMSAS